MSYFKGIFRSYLDGRYSTTNRIDLGVEALAGFQSSVFLDEREQVEWHLIVSALRNV